MQILTTLSSKILDNRYLSATCGHDGRNILNIALTLVTFSLGFPNRDPSSTSNWSKRVHSPKVTGSTPATHKTATGYSETPIYSSSQHAS